MFRFADVVLCFDDVVQLEMDAIQPEMDVHFFAASWRWLAQQSIFSRRFAPHFASRAINSTPGGRGAPPFALADVRREVRKRPPHAV